MVQALQIYCKIILNRLSSCQKLIKYVPLVGGGGLCVCVCVFMGGPSVSLGGSVWLHLEGPWQPLWCLQLWPPAPGCDLRLKRYHRSRVSVHCAPQRLPAALQTLPPAAWWGYHWGRSMRIPYVQILKAKTRVWEVGQGQSRKIDLPDPSCIGRQTSVS